MLIFEEITKKKLLRNGVLITKKVRMQYILIQSYLTHNRHYMKTFLIILMIFHGHKIKVDINFRNLFL